MSKDNTEWERVVATLDQDPSEGMNLARECCERWAGDPEHVALIVRHEDGGSERYTYQELSREAARAASAFAQAGLRRGDKVAAILTRQIEAWVAALGAWRLGLVYVPLFCGFGPEAMAQRLNVADVDAVVVDARWREVYESTRPLLGGDPQVFTVAAPGGEGLLAGDLDFLEHVARGEAGGQIAPTTADEAAVLLFTSGTTSEPKGCDIPHGGLISLLPWFDHSCGMDRTDLLFTTTDPGWSYGLLSTGAAPMSRGITRVMYTGDFDAGVWLDLVEEEQITHIAAVPTAFRKLVACARERDSVPTCVRGATSAGEPLDAPTVRGWEKYMGAPIRDGYGQTELGMLLANLAIDEEIVPGALSSVVPGWEVRLIDAEGRDVEGPGQGQIVVRRPPFQLTTMYVNARETWRDRWLEGDWFETHDVARRDDRGRYWFVGRDDDVIVTAGYNVGPAEIEGALLKHAAVAEVAVVAAPDPKRGGNAVRAVIVVAQGIQPSDELTAELQDVVRTGIGRHAYPRIVDYVAALPKTETGKLRRADLRRQLAGARSGDRA